MKKYSKGFIVGWSIGFALLVLFNISMFAAPLINDLVWSGIGGMGGAGILLVILFWPALLFGVALAGFGMILAILADITVLTIFYFSQKKRSA